MHHYRILPESASSSSLPLSSTCESSKKACLQIPNQVDVWASNFHGELFKTSDNNPRAPFLRDPNPNIVTKFNHGISLSRENHVDFEEVLCEKRGPERNSILDLIVEKKQFTLLRQLGLVLQWSLLADGKTRIGEDYILQSFPEKTVGLWSSKPYCYEGELNSGKPHGWGKMYFGERIVYEGSFLDGQKHGPGIEYETKGSDHCFLWSMTKEIWCKGERQSEEMQFFDQPRAPDRSIWSKTTKFFSQEIVTKWPYTLITPKGREKFKKE